MWWWNGDSKSKSGCLVFDLQENGKKYAIDVSKEESSDAQYSISFFIRDQKPDDDGWINKAVTDLKQQSYSVKLESDRYWIRNMSIEKILLCVETIINQPFEQT